MMAKKQPDNKAPSKVKKTPRRVGEGTVIRHADGRVEQEFTTSRGVKVFLSPIPPMMPDLLRELLEAEWTEAGKLLPVKPTYTVDVLGATQTHEHDETTLDTPAEKEAWAAYKAAEAAFSDEMEQRVFMEIVRDCMRFDIPADWPKRFAHLKPPKDDEYKQRWFYMRLTVIGSRNDIASIMSICSQLTGIDQSLISAAEDKFRGAMEKPEAAERPSES